MSKSNQDSQPWYQAGLRFRCTGCGECCTGAPGYVWVTQAEINEMAAAIGMDPDEFEDRYVRSVGIRKSLIELAGGDCVFFDRKSRKCRVYKHRPRQCRTFPFWASNLRSPADWEEMASRCPGANHGTLYTLEKIEERLKKVHV